MTACQFHKVGGKTHVYAGAGIHIGSLCVHPDSAEMFFQPKRGERPAAFSSRVLLSIGRKLAELNRAEPLTERA